ncbi:MAG TPA: thioesterase family protein [Steroidobacteraceae bacterium]|jgi:acyl-CoA thioesterase|nr:thioesterase family protein [Steroidobacteraceae bacterium]
MLFSETLASIRPHGAGVSAVIGEDWSQGRATFGGLVAALGNEAMRRLVPAARALRGLETTFVGPAPAGDVRIDAEVLRVGKTVTVAGARLSSDGKAAATLTGVYGAARATALTITPAVAPGLPRAEELPDPNVPGMGGPSFLRHFDFRWAEGTPPFSASPLRTSKIYVRHRDTAPLSESHLVALIDCIPSVILQLLSAPTPSSSLTWSVQFLGHHDGFATDAWWRIDAEVNSAGEGYSCESCVLLDPNGAPAAIARQMVAVFG